MDPLTRIFVTVMCVLSASLGIANARPASATAPGIVPGFGQGVTTVTLRATVRLAPDAELTLGAVASIEGDQADHLRSLPITGHTPTPGVWNQLTAESVREAVNASAAHIGSIVVVGPGVSLTRLRVVTESPAQPRPEPAEDQSVVRLSDHLESWLRARFDATPDTIRVLFDDRDRELVRTPTDGRLVSVTEIGISGKIALRVEIYEDDHLVLSESLRVGVQVRAEALVMDRPVRRGSPLRASDARRETVWTDPTDPPAPPAASIGQALLRSLQPGQVVREHHLEPAVMIERGQDVSVRTVHGSVVVSTVARARQSARKGELIELEAKDGSRRRFTARVDGPGRAIMAPSTPAADTTTETPPAAADTPTNNAPATGTAPARITISDPDPPEMSPIRQNTPELQPIRKAR